MPIAVDGERKCTVVVAVAMVVVVCAWHTMATFVAFSVIHRWRSPVVVLMQLSTVKPRLRVTTDQRTSLTKCSLKCQLQRCTARRCVWRSAGV